MTSLPRRYYIKVEGEVRLTWCSPNYEKGLTANAVFSKRLVLSGYSNFLVLI